MVAVDFNVLKDCKRRGHGGSTLASNDGRWRLFRAGIKLSGPSTQPLPKIGPNLIDDLGLPVLMSVVNETWTRQPHPHCFLFQGADIIFSGFFFIIVYPEPRIPIRDRLAAWPDIVQSDRLT